ncbi:hypothetical protein [Paenibacillus sp. PL2-23]|uniref:hypothetical protein n=1 Tax=Paenibacillus sp. PL2-23 TaxID=2100729 RepID=UPI0030F57158
MKLVLLIAMLIGGAIGGNGETAGGGTTEVQTEGLQQVQPLIVSESPPVAAAVHVLEGVTAEASVSVRTADLSRDEQAESDAPETSYEQALLLQSVGGISLYDTPSMVVDKLGQPEEITQDEILAELQLYRYASLTVAFYGEYVQYVDVPLQASLIIDGNQIPMTEAGLTAYLGEPAYIAEDGIVFQSGEALLKLYLDSETKQPVYASYYHIATV